MTSIDFHFNTPDRLHYACRLVRKVINANQANATQPLAVFCSDEDRLNRFDQLLWGVSGADFLPHVRADDPQAPHTPILLLTKETPLHSHHLLLNLDDAPPAFFPRFIRMLEVVSNDADDKEKARARFMFYRDRGYVLNKYDLAKTSS
jgi:DNA polymerase III subunit chi